MTYKDFIENILSTRGRFSCDDRYHERHHILPKCQGGTNDEDNLIDLYAKEHYIAHKLLCEENPDNDKLKYAFYIMAFAKTENQERYSIDEDEYEKLREELSAMQKDKYKDKTKHPSYGTHLSEERKKHIGDINRGNKYSEGRIVSEETRKKIGQANKNPSEETRKKMSQSQKGRLSGGKNIKAKKIRKISTGVVYECMKDAAEEIGMSQSTFRGKMRKGTLEDYEYVV